MVKENSTKMLITLGAIFGLCYGMRDGWVPSELGTYCVAGVAVLGIIARLIQDIRNGKYESAQKSIEKIEE
jgi:hypothetical protein